MTITHCLGIDQAATSGWGLRKVGERRRFELHGIARTAMQRRDVLDKVEFLMRLEGDPYPLSHLLVVLEDHSKMPIQRKAKWSRDPVTGEVSAPERSTATILGMGGARDRWREQLELREHPLAFVLFVEPTVWRRAVLGTRCNLSTEAWKAQAVMWATATSGDRIHDHNEAEGMCLAAWGAEDGVQRFMRSDKRAWSAS